MFHIYKKYKMLSSVMLVPVSKLPSDDPELEIEQPAVMRNAILLIIGVPADCHASGQLVSAYHVRGW